MKKLVFISIIILVLVCAALAWLFPTPLHFAAYVDSSLLAKTAIAFGADTQSKEPLSFDGEVKIKGGEPLCPNMTPLEMASRFGSVDVAKELLSNDVDPDSGSCSPLWIAAFELKHEMVRLLLEHGADPNAISTERMTEYAGTPPIYVAIRLHDSLRHVQEGQSLQRRYVGTLETIKLLLEHGADPNLYYQSQERKNRTETPLYIAIMVVRSHPDVIRLLLDYGADPDIKIGGTTIARRALLQKVNRDNPKYTAEIRKMMCEASQDSSNEQKCQQYN